MATKVIERIRAHYEVQDLEMGKVYRWCPESIVVECEKCGASVALTALKRNCSECGADHEAIIEKEGLEARPEEEGEHPWRSLSPYYFSTRGT